LRLPLAKGKYRKPARVLSGFLSFLALAVWLFHFHVWYEYDSTRPCQRDALSGRLFAQNTHGHVVYLTKEEDTRLTRLTVLAFGLFGIVLFIEFLFVEKITPAPWEKRQW
jgi:hypothetical protein